MKGEIFENTLVFIPLKKGGSVSLRIQSSEENLAIRAASSKGETDEEEALGLIELLHQLLDKAQISHQSTIRNPKEGKRIDMVVIPYKRE